MPITHTTRSLSTEAARAGRRWYIADAEGQVLGRLATRIATVLRGKHTPAFSPHLDAGDFVIVVNAKRIRLTGKKLSDKTYYRHSGYPGGIRQSSAQQVLDRHPARVIREAVEGMLPKNRLGRRLATKLKVYPDRTIHTGRRSPNPSPEADMTAEMSGQSNVFRGTGKRKTSVARVILKPGEGEFVVNDRQADEYFGRESSRMIIRQPFDVTSTVGQYRVDVNVYGGGVSAQAVAIRHGVTRALLQVNPELRPPLKKAGFITRDSREVERKKYGRHKARKRPQYSKR